MGNTINYIILYVSISIMLYAGQIVVSGEGYFGDDLISQWVSKDANGDFNSYNSNYVATTNSTFNSASTTKGLIGTVLLNFWDLTQIVWSFMIMIFNIIFIIPLSLMKLQLPNAIKLGFVVPLVIVGTSIFIFGIFGRR